MGDSAYNKVRLAAVSFLLQFSYVLQENKIGVSYISYSFAKKRA